MQQDYVSEENMNRLIEPEKLQKHDQEEREKINQQVFEQLKAISEVEENFEPSRNEIFIGNS